MIQSLLTKETPEIIRFFRNIDSLSEMSGTAGGEITSGSERRTLHYGP